MTELNIIKYPDPFLKTIVEDVKNIKDPAIQQIIDDMLDTLYVSNGVGLASTQVGIKDSIIVYDESKGQNDPQVLLNAGIMRTGLEKFISNEGCLCIPEVFIPIRRYYEILVSGQRRDGESVEFAAENSLSAVLQHEIDHLKGMLIIDRLSSLQRKIYKKRLKGLK